MGGVVRIASPAAVLNILLTANTLQANAALAKTQGQLAATGKTAQATGATMKKAFIGIGVAAGAAGVALYKIGEDFDNAYDKIRTRTGATGKEMVKLKRAFRDVVADVPASFEDASTAVGDLNTRLGLSGKPLRHMSKQMLELSRITDTDVKGNIEAVSKAFVDWEVKTKDQSKTLDGFFRLSQRSGLAVADIASYIQKFGSPLRQFGFNINEAAAMFANFERSGVNIQTMVPGLKLALSALNKPVADTEAIFRKFGVTIGEPEKGLRQVFALLSDKSKLSDIDKISLAMATFGKRAGADMKEAIEQGRFELDKFIKLAESGKGSIIDTGNKTMDAAEAFQELTNNVKLALEPLAKDVFKGLGDLMKDITRGFKKEGVSGAINVLSDKLAGAAPKIAEAGLKLGGALIKGIGQAFLQTNLLGKIAIAGTLLKVLGPKGALLAVGTKIGGWVVKGLLLAFGSNAAAAWGLMKASWLIQAFGGIEKLKALGSGVGKWIGRGLGAGIIIGLLLLDDDIRKEAKKLLNNVIDIVRGELLDRPSGEAAAMKFEDFLDPTVFDKGMKVWLTHARSTFTSELGTLVFNNKTGEIIKAKGKILQQLVGKTIQEAVTIMGSGEFKRSAEVMASRFDIPLKKARDLKQFMNQNPGLGAREALDVMERAGRSADKAWDRSTSNIRGDAKKTGDALREHTQHGGKAVEKNLGDASRKGQDHAKDLRMGVGHAVFTLGKAIANGMGNIGGNVNRALKSLGVRNEVNFGIKPPSSQEVQAFHQRGGIIEALQRGGTLVGGSGFGDKVPAMLEPGEVVINRQAVKALGGAQKANRINKLIPRFQTGGVAGGLDFALGPYTIPPIRYDPAHAGGNSHVHISGSPPSWVVGVGRKLQSMGFMVGEHPAFGGVTSPNHAHYGATDHWHGGAIDVNSAADETRAEVAQIAGLLRSGKIGAAVEKIKRVILKQVGGSSGRHPLQEAGQSALDKVWRGANQYLAKQAPVEATGATRGHYDAAQLARLWSSTGSNGSARLMAAIAMAESGGDPRADNGIARGLWQIIAPTWAEYGSGSWGNAFNPVMNARAAHAILRGSGLQAWEAYTNGAYSQFMQNGGIVQKLQGGGVATMPKDVSFSGHGGEEPRIPAMEWLRALGNTTNPLPRMKEIVGAVGLAPYRIQEAQNLSSSILDYESFAGAASALDWEETLYDPTTGEVTGTKMHQGIFRGFPAIDLGQGGWLNLQLLYLWTLRNKLLTALPLVQKLSDYVKQRVNILKGQRGEVAKALQRLKATRTTLKTKLSNLQTQLADLQKLEPTPERQQRIQALRGRIETVKDALKVVDAQIGYAQRRHDRLPTLIEHMNTRATDLGTIAAEIISGGGDYFPMSLEELQGRVPDRNVLPALTSTSDLGILGGLTQTYGGSIGSIAGELLAAYRAVGEAMRAPAEAAMEVAGEVTSTTEDQLTAMRLELAMQEIARLRVGALQMPIWEDLRARQIFHGGGVVQGAGDQRVVARAGEGIFTPEQMAALGGAASVTVIIEDGAVDARRIKTLAADGTREAISSARRTLGAR